MINLTDHIQLLVTAESLDSAIRTTLTKVIDHLTVRYGMLPSRPKWDSAHAFQYFFRRDRIQPNARFDEPFLHRSLSFSNSSMSNEHSDDFFVPLKPLITGPYPAASGFSSIKQGLKLLFVEMWQQGHILLPSIFYSRPYFRPVTPEHEIYAFLIRYEDSSAAASSTPRDHLSCVDCQRMALNMPRVLWTTSWRVIEDIDIFELAELHRAGCLFHAGEYQPHLSVRNAPLMLFLSEVLRTFPARAQYNGDLLRLYSRWLMGRYYQKTSFADFVNASVAESDKLCTRYEGSSKASVGDSDSHLDGMAPPRPLKVGGSTHDASEMKRLAQSKLHSDALEYFKESTKYRSFAGVASDEGVFNYPGREHCSNPESMKLWRRAFRQFLHYRRQVKKCETYKECAGSLSILEDYLFLYIPWWQEIFPNVHIIFPSSPKLFTRYPFVDRSEKDDDVLLPRTLLQMVELRRATPETQYPVLKHLAAFFSFVEGFYSQDEEMAGPAFRNPIVDKFDISRIKKRTKTSKVPFPKNTYAYLLYYGYALESFGMFLQERAKSGLLSASYARRLSRARFIDANAIGFVPFVRFRNTITPVHWIPNVYIWAKRRIRVGERRSMDVWLPHLTNLRLCVAAIELGLRLVGLRYLDRRTWDKDNEPYPAEEDFSVAPTASYVYSLHVNTDKVRNEPWNTWIVFRVRALLKREELFQNSIDEPDINEEVPYQGRQDSRFGNILPLFRNANTPGCINEQTYQSIWVIFLIGFQEFFALVNGSYVAFVTVESTKPRDGQIKEVRDEDTGAYYCPVSILPIHTPHACRASYATNRSGILELSDIANELGHLSLWMTGYYQKPRAEDLKLKLEASDRQMTEGEFPYGPSQPVYIRADKQDGALAQSFRKDRDGTIKRFSFMAASCLWSLTDTERVDEQGLDALRNGPMSRIRLRETHICPVGEECPSEIVEKIGAAKRCGLCPLAMKCVDHLPAIAAKKRLLQRRIRYAREWASKLESNGETAAAESVWQELELDTNELLGWQLSDEILNKMRSELQVSSDSNGTYFAEQPEIVRKHLERVVTPTSETAFLLQQIIDADSFPSLQSPEIRSLASQLRRRLLAGKTAPFSMEIPTSEDVEIAAKFLKTVMDVRGLSLEQIGAALNSQSLSSADGLLLLDSRN